MVYKSRPTIHPDRFIQPALLGLWNGHRIAVNASRHRIPVNTQTVGEKPRQGRLRPVRLNLTLDPRTIERNGRHLKEDKKPTKRKTALELQLALPVFLSVIAETGRIMDACKSAGITWAEMDLARKQNRKLSDAFDEAMEIYKDTLRAEVHRRGVKGVERPIYYKGQRIDQGESIEYSDRLLELLVKRHCPEFREKVSVDHAVTGGVLVLGGTIETIEDWSKKHGGTIDVESKPRPKQ